MVEVLGYYWPHFVPRDMHQFGKEVNVVRFGLYQGGGRDRGNSGSLAFPLKFYYVTLQVGVGRITPTFYNAVVNVVR